MNASTEKPSFQTYTAKHIPQILTNYRQRNTISTIKSIQSILKNLVPLDTWKKFKQVFLSHIFLHATANNYADCNIVFCIQIVAFLAIRQFWTILNSRGLSITTFFICSFFVNSPRNAFTPLRVRHGTPFISKFAGNNIFRKWEFYC